MTDTRPTESGEAVDPPTSPAIIALAWLLVLVPLGYGFIQTLLKAVNLFTG